jgi:hypothetical protein
MGGVIMSEDRLDRLEQMLSTLLTNQETQTLTILKDIKKELYGNGQPGLIKEVTTLNERVSTISKQIGGHIKNHWTFWVAVSAPSIILIISVWVKK